MLHPSRRTPWTLPALGLAALLAACGGGTRQQTPTPPAPREGQAPRTATDVPLVRTDTSAGQVVAPTMAPQLYGVDLDTVQAGEFDFGKMWTFDNPPAEYFARTYGLNADSAWFAKARLGALRIPGCSASFVSPNGLVMTNHHCAREFVTQVQKPGEDLLAEGFYAKNLADEREVHDFHADQLVDIVDVTGEVDAQLEGVAMEERSEQRDSVLEQIKDRITQERGGEDAGVFVEMVSLYNGGRTSAYVFHRYETAKLVMAPEVGIGFFGGDPDNFTYPRYNLDFSFFRLYDEQGNPLKTDHYFKVDTEGLSEGDPVFVVGNPGSTSRLQTVAELEFRRDVSDRDVLQLLRSRMAVLKDYMDSHPDVAKARDLENKYFGLSNSEKAYAGQVGGLEDPVIIARRRDAQEKFQKAIQDDPQLSGTLRRPHRPHGRAAAGQAGAQGRLRRVPGAHQLGHGVGHPLSRPGCVPDPERPARRRAAGAGGPAPRRVRFRSGSARRAGRGTHGRALPGLHRLLRAGRARSCRTSCRGARPRVRPAPSSRPASWRTRPRPPRPSATTRSRCRTRPCRWCAATCPSSSSSSRWCRRCSPRRPRSPRSWDAPATPCTGRTCRRTRPSPCASPTAW